MTSVESGQWKVRTHDASGPSDERVKGEGHVDSVSELFFGFINGIKTLKCNNFLVKHPFVIPFASICSL
jgi:hypothetical protein